VKTWPRIKIPSKDLPDGPVSLLLGYITLYSMFSFPLHDVVDITNTLTQWRYFLFTSPLFNLPSFNFSPSPPSINQPSSNFLDHSTCRPGISMTYSSGLPVRSFLFSSLFTSLHFTSLLFIYPTRLLHITYISHLGQSPCTSYLIRRPTLYRRTRLSSSRQRRSHQSLGRSQHDRTSTLDHQAVVGDEGGEA
jgi:hypothetical protein